MALRPEIDELRTQVESASAAKESLAGEENELRVSLESAEADAAEAVLPISRFDVVACRRLWS